MKATRRRGGIDIYMYRDRLSPFVAMLGSLYRFMGRNTAMTDVFYELTCVRWRTMALLSFFSAFIA